VGVPTVHGGALSVDIVTETRFAAPQVRSHRVEIVDTGTLPNLGETQISVETAPGATLVRTRLGGQGWGQLRTFRYHGPGAREAVSADVTTDPALIVDVPASGPATRTPAAPGLGAPPRRVWLDAATLVLAAATLTLLLVAVARVR